jgi:hypothetical protein
MKHQRILVIIAVVFRYNPVIFTIVIITWGFNIPDRDLGCCPDPGISGTSLRGISVAERMTQAKTGSGAPGGGEGSSRDPAMIEET